MSSCVMMFYDTLQFSPTTFYLLGIQAHFWSTRSVGSGPTRGEAPFDMVPVGKNI